MRKLLIAVLSSVLAASAVAKLPPPSDEAKAKAAEAAAKSAHGGKVEAFEQRWARLLGKETAVFMPSGTLANQLAVRALAGNKRRVIVPDMSHMYNDTGDACQTLSGLTLLPLAPLKATYTRADVEAVVKRTASGRDAETSVSSWGSSARS